MKNNDGNKFGTDMLRREPIESLLQQADWRHNKIQNGIAAADRNDFASDEELARVRAKFTVR